MAYDEDLADRVREHLGRAPVTEKRMFGGLGFLVGGNLAVAASGQGGLLVRVDPAESERLLEAPGVEPMQMGARRPMTGWLHVATHLVSSDKDLAVWVQRGIDFASTLTAK